MNDETRDQLTARLSQAKARAAALILDIQWRAASIQVTREALGNPFFYSARPEGHPESRANFTGYKSHDPGLALMLEFRRITKEITTIQNQLKEAGTDGS